MCMWKWGELMYVMVKGSHCLLNYKGCSCCNLELPEGRRSADPECLTTRSFSNPKLSNRNAWI